MSFNTKNRALWISWGGHCVLGGLLYLFALRQPIRESNFQSEPISVETRDSFSKTTSAPKPAQTSVQESSLNLPEEANAKRITEIKTASTHGGPVEINSVQTAESTREYILVLQRKIQAQEIYPLEARRRKQTGTIEIKFELSKEGRLLHFEVDSPASPTLLKEAALEAVKNAGPFPTPPAGISLHFRIPIRFNLDSGL